MPVLTLWQPWASLIALGAKTIETRGWSTSHRGRIAIHAAGRRPPLMHLPKLWSRGKTREEQERWNHETWLVIDTITDPAFQGPQPQGRRIPKRAQTPTLFFPHGGPHADVDPATEHARTMHLPLGAIVATATVEDVVPMVDRSGIPDDHAKRRFPFLLVDDLGLLLWHGPRDGYDVSAQRPLGVFAAGRYAWLLSDVEALPEPVPFRGGQGLVRKWAP